MIDEAGGMGLALRTDNAPSPTLSKATQQHLLLAETPKRRDILDYRVDWTLRALRIHVVRNCQFEAVAGFAAPFLAHADLAASWSYSDYDDSLSLTGLDSTADVVVVWLDLRRYGLEAEALGAFLGERLAEIRRRTDAPVLVADDPDSARAAAVNAALAAAAQGLSGVFVYPRAAIARQLGQGFHDPRLAALAGSDLSAAAGLLIARELGFSWLPALVAPALKCIALDLDNTLYAGVLGEDGPDGLVLTDAHRDLQARLAGFQAEGVLLALVSKNVPEDVEALFIARPDFPLRPEMITARAIGWGSKRAGLDDVARTLNIGVEAILFVDDNLGEIAQAAGVTALHAADPAATLRALEIFPGLRRLRVGAEDGLRASDIAMNQERQRLAATGQDYRAALEPRLSFRIADAASVGRAQELSNKTNQFNLALQRYTAAAATAFATGADTNVLEAALADKLSDSGVVMSLFARTQDAVLVVEDLCISCRALGRELEDAMILDGALGLAQRRGAHTLAFRHATGPRNQPARAWLQTIAPGPLPEAGLVEVSLDAARARLAAGSVAASWADEA